MDFCEDGFFKPGFEWAGSPDLGDGSQCAGGLTSTKTNCAEVYNFPAINCCICGKVFSMYFFFVGCIFFLNKE